MKLRLRAYAHDLAEYRPMELREFVRARRWYRLERSAKALRRLSDAAADLRAALDDIRRPIAA